MNEPNVVRSPALCMIIAALHSIIYYRLLQNNFVEGAPTHETEYEKRNSRRASIHTTDSQH